MTRGKIDLTKHPMAGKYRPPAKRAPRALPIKPGPEYRKIWRIVDGAVRDTFANHPEYLTVKGRDGARKSLVKRITGAVVGHADQARGRSDVVGVVQPTPPAAAELKTAVRENVGFMARSFTCARRAFRLARGWDATNSRSAA